MKTIEEVLAEHITGDALIPEGLAAALVEREQEGVDRLRLYADRLGLAGVVVSKVFAEVGLGEPMTDEMKAHVEQQYQAVLAEAREQAEARINMLRQMGAPIPAEVHAEVRDPLAEPIDVVIPDTPEE